MFRDFGCPNADLRQLKALLAARINGVLDERKLTGAEAQALTGYDAADFSRIRSANLRRLTIERLADILDELGVAVELEVTFRSKAPTPALKAP